MVTTTEEYVSSSEPFHDIDLGDYSTLNTAVSLEDFRPNTTEQTALHELRTDLFQCIVLQNFVSTESTHLLPALPSLINRIRKQTADKEVFNVT